MTSIAAPVRASRPAVRPARRLARSLGLVAAVLCASVAGFATPHAATAQEAPPTTVYLERAGHTLDGYFLDWWRAHGDLLGDPITEEFEAETPFSEDEAVVQYFEGAALVYLPDARTGEEVRLLPLGRDLRAEIEDRYFMAFAPVRAQACEGDDDCTLVVRTRHTIRGDFQEFWRGETGQLLGAPLSEEFKALDGKTIQVFENGALQRRRGEDVEVRPLGSEMAQIAGHDTEPIDAPEGVPAYDESLFAAPAIAEPDVAEPAAAALVAEEPVAEPVVDILSPASFGPGPQQGGAKEIVISISGQAMWAYENGELVTSTYVSTGTGNIIETITPLGYYTVHTKIDIQDMEGTLGGEYYFVADVPYVMYFDDLGNALHGAYWHDNFGTPMSHGCVNLPMDIAAFLYEWTPIGASVSVIE